MPRNAALFACGLLLAAGAVAAQEDRPTRVRRDRDEFASGDAWIYNDLEKGIALAGKTGKPMLVVFR